jgi:hypothetical protein
MNYAAKVELRKGVDAVETRAQRSTREAEAAAAAPEPEPDRRPMTVRSWELIEKLGAHECERDPTLTKADGSVKALQTPDGRRLHVIYNEASARGERGVPAAASVEKAAPVGGCCSHVAELERLADQHVAKSAADTRSRVTKAAAMVWAMRQRPDLYPQHREAH